MKITIEITANDKKDIKDAIKHDPRKAVNELNKAITKILYQVQRDAMREAPVNKQSGGGNLRQSIRARMESNLVGLVEVGAQYALYVHEGTAPHIITAVRAKALYNSKTGQFFGKKVNHPGTVANPFLKRAVDMNNDFASKTFREAVANIFK